MVILDNGHDDVYWTKVVDPMPPSTQTGSDCSLTLEYPDILETQFFLDRL